MCIFLMEMKLICICFDFKIYNSEFNWYIVHKYVHINTLVFGAIKEWFLVN